MSIPPAHCKHQLLWGHRGMVKNTSSTLIGKHSPAQALQWTGCTSLESAFVSGIVPFNRTGSCQDYLHHPDIKQQGGKGWMKTSQDDKISNENEPAWDTSHANNIQTMGPRAGEACGEGTLG